MNCIPPLQPYDLSPDPLCLQIPKAAYLDPPLQEDRLREVEHKVESAEREWSKRLETSQSELAEV